MWINPCWKLYYLAILTMRNFLPAFLMLLLACSRTAGQEKNAGGCVDQPVIRRIIIDGNNVTRRSVIVREIDIKEGESISPDSLSFLTEQNKLRLFNMQLFNEVEQHTERNGDDITWYIHVKERWYIIPSVTVQFADRNFNTWWVKENHDLRRISVGLTLTDKNFRGNLETLAVTAQDGYTQKLGIAYMRPYVNNGQTQGLGFSLRYAQSRQTYYTTDSNKLAYVGTYSGQVLLRQIEGGIGYVYRPAYAAKHIFQLNYKDYTVNDTLLKLNSDYYANNSTQARFVEFCYRFEYNGVDNWNYSLTGFKLVAQAVARQGFRGLNFQSYANVEAGMFNQIFPKWYTSVIFRGRLMYPMNLPYYFRGGLGTQTDYVRGYEYYVIDGYNYGLLRLDLKREIFNNTYSIPVKYFTAIPVRIYPKIFADVGYIRNPQPGSNFLSNRLLYSIGAGIDIVTLYDIKIRVEFAWNHLKQNGLYLHFNSE